MAPPFPAEVKYMARAERERAAKRVIRTSLLVAGVFLVVGAVIFWHAARAGSGAIESWVAGQIQSAGDAYLNPKLSFVDLDYEFPSTVRLRSLRLTAADPANPGKSVDIVACEQAEIELTEIPKAGQPIQIASIVLRKPVFQAIAAGAGSKRLIGFSELIKTTALGTATQPTLADLPRLSGLLHMKRVELIDGRIIADARVPGVPRMEIDKINTRLAVEPSGDGWYKLDTRITRAPIFDLAIAGRLNLDTFTAADAVITIKAQVAREHDGYLPPELQAFLRAHEVQGALEAKISAATLPLLDPGRGQMRMEASLERANLSFRDYRLPIDSLTMSAALDGGVLTLSKLDVRALRGTAAVQGALTFNAALDADLRVVVRNMVLDETIRDGSASAKDPKFGGRLNAQVAAAASLSSFATTQPMSDTWGRGKITIDQGQLVHIPVVQGLGRAITKSKSWLSGRGGKGKGSDRAIVLFTLRGRAARCSEMTYIGDVFAARGRGDVGFDQQLDLIVNAGPLEKMQSLLGKHVGGVFGKFTDALAGYHVTGTVREPEVGVQIAGGRINRAGRAVTGGLRRVGNGVGSLGERMVGTETDER